MASKRAFTSTLTAARRAIVGTTSTGRALHVLVACRTNPAVVPVPASSSSFVCRKKRREYSQQAASSSSSKIWSFEDVRKLTTTQEEGGSGEGKGDGVVVVDVREPNELQSTGRIPTAVNIPITSAPESFHLSDEDFADRFGYARPGKDTEVVFYCKAGVRSRAAAGLARAAGWTKVGEYPGSWMDWAAKGGKIEKK